MALCLHVCLIICLFGASYSKPVKKHKKDDLSVVKNKGFLPPDHIKGLKLERDGHVNQEFHHEAFLGDMIKKGHLLFENMDGYKKLIEIFHKVDKNGDHLVDQAELTVWIHAKIKEHMDESRKQNAKLFHESDLSQDGRVHWKEYLMKLLDKTYGQNGTNNTLEDATGGLDKHYEAFDRADLDQKGFLNQDEFLYFLHPEHNPQTIRNMAEDMIASLDKNGDKVMTIDEFASVPPGEVDESEKEAEQEYLEGRHEEFNRMDEDHDGIVTVDELDRYLDPSHEQHSVNEAKYLISVSDRNHDGKLSEREMLMNYQLFTGSSMSNYAGALHDEF